MANQIMPCFPWRTRHKVHPFKLWHMSLMIANQMLLHLPRTPINRDPSQSYGRFRNIQKSWNSAESSSKAFKNIKSFNLRIQRTFKTKAFKSSFSKLLESSSKAYINTKRLQISETLQIQVSKTPKELSLQIFEDEEHLSKSFFQVSKFY